MKTLNTVSITLYTPFLPQAAILGPFLLSPPLSPWPSPCLSGAGAQRKGVWGWAWGACVRRGWTVAGGPWTCVRPGWQSWRGRSYRVSFWGIPRRCHHTAYSFSICWTFCGSASVFPPSSWSAAGSPVQRTARVNISVFRTWWSDWSKVILNIFTVFADPLLILHSSRHLGLNLVTKTLTYVVQFIVEAAGVAHGVPVGITPPESGGGGLTVGTAGARSPGGRLRRAQEVVKRQNRTKTVQCVPSTEPDR